MYSIAKNLACLGGEDLMPTLVPTINPPTQPAINNSSSLKTFTDQNHLCQIEVPADWAYSHKNGQNYYLDVLLSPDEAVKVENIVYNDGKPFTGSQNNRFVLGLLNRFYSKSGNVGDIKVTNDSILEDGSERLTWTSRSGGYSDVSTFEIHGKDRETFLMLTVYWLDSVESKYHDVVNKIIESYRIP